MSKFPQAHIFYNFFDLMEFLQSMEDLNQNDVKEFIDGIRDSGYDYGSMMFLGHTFDTRHPYIRDIILDAGFIKDEDGDIRFRMDY